MQRKIWKTADARVSAHLRRTDVMTWDPGRERLKGRLMLAGYALVADEVVAWALSIVLAGIHAGLPRWWLPAFGAAMMPLAMKWIAGEAQKACRRAVSQRFLGFEGVPPRVVSIANDCPGRWLVLLHIQMHPELRWREDPPSV